MDGARPLLIHAAIPYDSPTSRGEQGIMTLDQSNFAGNELNTSFRTKESQVADFLRERIISGFYQRGERLKQAEIAQFLDLSITPVREALKMLEAEGYVIGASHRGVFVAPFQVDEVEELFELRLDLESRLSREAVQRITPAEVEALAAINREIAEAERAQDRAAHRSGNFRFHFRFYEIAQQPQTLHFVRILWARFPFDLLAIMPNRGAQVIDEHQEFLDALAKGDSAGAVRAMRSHIERGWRRFRKQYATPSPTRAPRKTP